MSIDPKALKIFRRAFHEWKGDESAKNSDRITHALEAYEAAKTICSYAGDAIDRNALESRTGTPAAPSPAPKEGDLIVLDGKTWRVSIPGTGNILATEQPVDCRKAFESWRKNITSDADYAEDFCGHSAWEGWQAAWKTSREG